MVIFHSYVSLPEGMMLYSSNHGDIHGYAGVWNGMEYQQCDLGFARVGTRNIRYITQNAKLNKENDDVEVPGTLFSHKSM